MKLIIITTEDFFDGEALAINALFNRGMDTLHLRKPASTESELKNLIQQIDKRFHRQLVLHDHFALTKTFRMRGVHLNRRNPVEPAQIMPVISRSCHTIGELKNITKYERVFFSPVFDSISKPGYMQAFTPEDLFIAKSAGFINDQVFALGGIDSDNIPILGSYGFGGVAVIGALWRNFPQDRDEEALLDRFDRLLLACRKVRLYNGGILFITHPIEGRTYYKSVDTMLMAGCRMIQLRMKGEPLWKIRRQGIRINNLCRQYCADLYINDHVELCKELGAAGVHLGRLDMPPREARKILGDRFIIGGTANTFDDIFRLNAEGVDYIGLGPFRFTTTKKNLSPVLGLSGYKQIMEQCRNHKINLPVYAIGGITSPDILDILKTGISGIAFSARILTKGHQVE